jgi:hypothetical protein
MPSCNLGPYHKIMIHYPPTLHHGNVYRSIHGFIGPVTDHTAAPVADNISE